MDQYLDILKKILENGEKKESRAGDTIALFAQQMRFDLSKGFPAVTTKKLAWNAVKSELLWFIEGVHKDGRVSEKRLREINGTDRTIWTANAEASYWKPKFDGDLGRVYGAQWRDWNKEIDQLSNLIETLKKDPNSRRLIVSAWNPSEIKDMALPPCHTMFQLFHINGKLSLHMYQRSCDMFLGVPFNIASYALLLSMIAHCTNLEAHELVMTLGDAHIYTDHIDAVNEQLKRKPLKLPKLHLSENVKNIDEFKMDDIKLIDYVHHDPIKAKMAV